MYMHINVYNHDSAGIIFNSLTLFTIMVLTEYSVLSFSISKKSFLKPGIIHIKAEKSHSSLVVFFQLYNTRLSMNRFYNVLFLQFLYREIIRKKALMTMFRFWKLNPEACDFTQYFNEALFDTDPAVMGTSLIAYHDVIAVST